MCYKLSDNCNRIKKFNHFDAWHYPQPVKNGCRYKTAALLGKQIQKPALTAGIYNNSIQGALLLRCLVLYLNAPFYAVAGSHIHFYISAYYGTLRLKCVFDGFKGKYGGIVFIA